MPSLPAACANCVRTVIGAHAGAVPTSIPSQQYRSADGQIRFDSGNISLITNPKTGVRILLNHLTQEARMLLPSGGVGGALPSVGGSLGVAGVAGLGGLPMGAPSLSGAGVNKATLIQLGKGYIEGHEVEGVRQVFPATAGAPPPNISMWEQWTSTKLKLPVLTKTVGSFGQSTTVCNCSAVPPPQSMFEAPSNYKVVNPPPGLPSNVAGLPGVGH